MPCAVADINNLQTLRNDKPTCLSPAEKHRSNCERSHLCMHLACVVETRRGLFAFHALSQYAKFPRWRPCYRRDSYTRAHLSLSSTTAGRIVTCLPAPDVKEAGNTATSTVTKMSCLPDALQDIREKKYGLRR